MAEWLWLNRKRLNKATEKTIKGAEVTVLLSPYDIPEAVRGGLVSSSGRFAIQFKYQGGPEDPDEPLDAESEDGPVVLRVGRNSHRLYRIQLDVKSLDIHQVELRVLQEVGQAIDRLSASRRRPPNRGRYDVARQVLSERGHDLVKELVTGTPR